MNEWLKLAMTLPRNRQRMLANRITTTLYLARCRTGRAGVDIVAIIRGWHP